MKKIDISNTRLRRLSAICRVLNSNETLKLDEIRRRSSDLMDSDFSPSTLDKDLAYLKMNFDVEITHCGSYGLRLAEPFDFIDRLRSYLNLF